MIYAFLLGGLFLGWSFGRSNLSTVFGTAVGTRMVSFRFAASLAAVFIFLGAVLSSSETAESVLEIGRVGSIQGAFLISCIIGCVMLLANYWGVPVSIVQCFIGALIGWNCFFQIQNNWVVLMEMISAWFYAPLLAAFFAGICFCIVRYVFYKVHFPILYRDFGVRILLILGGVYSSYFLGANNMPAIAGPYLSVNNLAPLMVILSIGIAICIGIFMADKKVISMVSSGLFPLSSLEALVVVFSCGLALCCFSSRWLCDLLISCGLPSFPLVPIPTTNILVGSIVGVGCTKKCSGVQWRSLIKIVVSWFWVPLISGLICWFVLAMLNEGGIVL